MRYLIWLGVLGCGVVEEATGTHTDGDACAFGGGEASPLDFAVDAMGPYQVGYRSWDVTYAPLPGASRTIHLSVWYPTRDTVGTDVLYRDIVPAAEELGDAKPAEPAFACGYPVVAYSHGDQAYGASSADLMRYYASHGWIGVAPDHTDNLLWADVEPEAQGHWYHRPLDIRHAVDALEDLEPADPLAGLADTSRVLMSGHSRGTTTVWAVAGATFDMSQASSFCPGCSAEQLARFDDLADPRMKAFLPLAGSYRTSLYGEDGHLSAAGPWMMQTGGADKPGAADTWARVQAQDFTWLELAGGCHQTFALGVCGTLDSEEGFHMVNTYALAFGRAHVLGDDAPEVLGLLDGSTELDERVTLQRKVP